MCAEHQPRLAHSAAEFMPPTLLLAPRSSLILWRGTLLSGGKTKLNRMHTGDNELWHRTALLVNPLLVACVVEGVLTIVRTFTFKAETVVLKALLYLVCLPWHLLAFYAYPLTSSPAPL